MKSDADILNRFDRIRQHVNTFGGNVESHLVTSGLLVLASVLRDCDFQTDMEAVANVLDTGLDRIAEHVSASLGGIDTAIRNKDTA